jgi:hypothetical protein
VDIQGKNLELNRSFIQQIEFINLSKLLMIVIGPMRKIFQIRSNTRTTSLIGYQFCVA